MLGLKRIPDVEREDMRGSHALNVSHIIANFLFMGAGVDRNGKTSASTYRGVMTQFGEPEKITREKENFFHMNRIKFVLNIASMDKEINGSDFPGGYAKDVILKKIPMRDRPDFTEPMGAMLDDAADFIELALKDHREAVLKKRNDFPTILVHCVAGVNRSAMAVVWWLAKYHGFTPREAASIVRRRREKQCSWESGTVLGERGAWLKAAERLLE